MKKKETVEVVAPVAVDPKAVETFKLWLSKRSDKELKGLLKGNYDAYKAGTLDDNDLMGV